MCSAKSWKPFSTIRLLSRACSWAQYSTTTAKTSCSVPNTRSLHSWYRNPQHTVSLTNQSIPAQQFTFRFWTCVLGWKHINVYSPTTDINGNHERDVGRIKQDVIPERTEEPSVWFPPAIQQAPSAFGSSGSAYPTCPRTYCRARMPSSPPASYYYTQHNTDSEPPPYHNLVFSRTSIHDSPLYS